MRNEVITAIDVAVSSGARISKACEAINLCERRLRRWKKISSDNRKGGYRARDQKLSALEENAIVENFSTPELKEVSVRVAHAILMDRNIYIASPASCIRVLKRRELPTERTNFEREKRVRPALKATGSCQVWSWDVTWLPSLICGKYFYLYLILDMYSRFIIDWTIETTEDAVFARHLFSNAFTDHEIDRNTILTVHADNGQMMRSKVLKELFKDLSVKASHSRPHTSNDNAFSESLFSTLKNRVLYPEKFNSIEDAKKFTERFVEWYNFEHKHSELNYLSPYEVHENIHTDILRKRNELLKKNRETNPSRHGGLQKTYSIPEVVELKHRVNLKKVA